MKGARSAGTPFHIPRNDRRRRGHAQLFEIASLSTHAERGTEPPLPHLDCGPPTAASGAAWHWGLHPRMPQSGTRHPGLPDTPSGWVSWLNGRRPRVLKPQWSVSLSITLKWVEFEWWEKWGAASQPEDKRRNERLRMEWDPPSRTTVS